jgi:glutamate--cysteine ligase catalytic subunit
MEVYSIDVGIDELLARHYAHLFIRDPLVIFKELLDVDDTVSSDHFENIQSTNWQTMRFKPPTPGSNIGWRVEFRSMDIQLTDYENACFAVFIVLLARVINHFDLNLYIPISKVDDNMARSQKRNAVLEEQFWFRNDVSRGICN